MHVGRRKLVSAAERRLLLAVAKTVHAMLMAMTRGQTLYTGQIAMHNRELAESIKKVGKT